MLINFVPGEECRIAVVENGRLEDFYQERASTESHVSNIYKGRVTNVEPAIQAAFVDFGLERNGFLHISDLHPKYFSGKDREEFEKVGQKTARHERPPIQKCLKRGQEVLVQVLKEGLGSKGPTLTSYLSIPGRFLVMMPDMQRLGVSRKVEDDDARKEMRDILKTLDPPKEFGFIVRTAGIGQTKTDIKRDLSYLQRLWKNIERKRKRIGRTGELYAESDLVIRTIRDVFSSEVDRIVCDNLEAARRAEDFLSVANPRTKSQVVYYDDPVPLFHRFGIESQIDHMGQHEVPLPAGGALVIDQTEALVAVDVNSGKSRNARDAETNAYKTNMEAVDEIARQLRLRDLGGLVVLDLIDMRPLKNRKAVETRFRNNLKRDRARSRIGSISQFGLLEMTRQRMRPSLRKSVYQECAHCLGRGYSMSAESVVLHVMRRLALVMHRKDVARIELTISPDVAFHILNRKRSELVELERRHGKSVMVRVGGATVDFINVAALDERGTLMPIDWEAGAGSPGKADAVHLRELNDPALPPPDVLTARTDDDDEEEEETRQDEPRGDETSQADAQGDDQDAGQTPSAEDEPDKPRKRRRHRGGRGRKRKADDGDERQGGAASAQGAASSSEHEPGDQDHGDRRPSHGTSPPKARPSDSGDTDVASDDEASPGSDGESQEKPKRRRRRRRSRSNSEASGQVDEQPQSQLSSDGPEPPAQGDADAEASASQSKEGETLDEPQQGKPKRRRRRRGGRKRSADSGQAGDGSTDNAASGGAGAAGGTGGTGGFKSDQASQPPIPFNGQGSSPSGSPKPEAGGSADTARSGGYSNAMLPSSSGE